MNTVAIILGASQFEKHTGFRQSDGGPAFKVSAKRVVSLLGDRCELDHHKSILDLFDSADPPLDQLVKIREFLRTHASGAYSADDTPRNLVVYYVGHGAFTGYDSYFLALRNTDEENPDYTGLSVQALVNQLSNNFSGSTYLVLDCCFAGKIVDAFQSDGVTRVVGADLDKKVEDTGVAVLCASSKHDVANSLGQEGMTQFSECLAEVLDSGLNSVGEWLTFRDVGNATKRLVKERFGEIAAPPEIHSPVQGRADTDPSDRPLFKNPSWNPVLSEFDDALASSLQSQDLFARRGAIDAIEEILSNPSEAPAKKAAILKELESRLELNGGERDFQLREQILGIVSTFDPKSQVDENQVQEPAAVYSPGPAPTDTGAHDTPFPSIGQRQVSGESEFWTRLLIWIASILIVVIPVGLFFVNKEDATTMLRVFGQLFTLRNLMGLGIAAALLVVALLTQRTPRAASSGLLPVSRLFALGITSLLIVANASDPDRTEVIAIGLLAVIVLAHEYWMRWLQVTARVRAILGNCFLILAMAFCLAATAEAFNENEYLTIAEGVLGLIIWSAVPSRHQKLRLSDDLTLKIDSIKASELRDLFRTRYGAAAPIQSNRAVNRIMNHTFLSVEAYLAKGKLLAGFANLIWSGDGPAEVDYIVTRDRINRIALDILNALEKEAKAAGIDEIQISNKALNDGGLRELVDNEHEAMGYTSGLCYTKRLT